MNTFTRVYTGKWDHLLKGTQSAASAEVIEAPVAPIVEIPAPVKPAAPKKTGKSESDKARAWLKGLDLSQLAKDETVGAEFFKYTVSVHHNDHFGFYLFTKSPQQKQWDRSLPTCRARGTAEDLTVGLERFITEQEAKQERHNAQKTAKQQARAQFKNPYNVGDFLYSSWGYDQTNREFYQVLEVRPLALLVREVSQERERTGHDSGICSPVRDGFIEESKWITIQVDARGSFSVPSPIHGNLYTYEGTPVYFSDGY